mmetsp:Transcript_5008/g.7278  ORF Transcript_5008/g.7278 Transcript_5008/m.7278 type:complete len:426 (+) Transcript_5008:129-1406(+)|eukprot:CAMPEP_0202455258 /NCGR_PEP_ID=MMETSP1360-20130828/12830_1 /ASSEMBLY_ACC=CAM_ASM_000848 /TAXON_ID=515479 /ORGANISM="Licmophora paradoxa, Strain CCMP2313" /LENGTH=425 /DNA_ID=CAMNT_0049074799 /DNA_START=81 /DNA_END=1358 /DNA_ORIENTATION=-
MVKFTLTAISVILTTILMPACQGFSAHLSRPWEVPVSRIDQKRSSGAVHVYINGDSESDDELSVESSNDGDVSDGDDEIVVEKSEKCDESMVLQHSREKEAPQATAKSNITPSKSQGFLTVQNGTQDPTIKTSWRQLLGMCRPSNFLGVLVFHVLGTYLGLKGTSHSLLSILLKPRMIVVLTVMILISATSMMVNDYYDCRSGVDAGKRHKPLIGGSVTFPLAKRFLSYLYAMLLLGAAVVPGAMARLTVMFATFLTFWYTKHLKPIPWIKNVTCAAIIALLPLTSGSAALNMVGATNLEALRKPALWRLVAILFFGFLGREIMMDINDVVDDGLHKIRTIPVTYGRKFASFVALGCTVLMSGLSLVGSTASKQVALASLGSLAMSRRAWQVYNTEGNDSDLIHRAVEEGKSTIMFIVAAFALSG